MNFNIGYEYEEALKRSCAPLSTESDHGEDKKRKRISPNFDEKEITPAKCQSNNRLLPKQLRQLNIPKYAMKLNLQQRAAVMTDPFLPLVILAGAGSGKTSTLCTRIVHILSTTQDPTMLVMTFTRTAAQEMRERIINQIGKTLADKCLTITTIHAFCLQVCRRFVNDLDGFKGKFAIYTSERQLDIIKSIMSRNQSLFQVENNSMNARARHILNAISRAKRQMKAPSTCKGEIRQFYQCYEIEMRKVGAMDFIDLVKNAIHLMQSKPKVLDFVREKSKFILIDEFQDTSTLQLHMVKILAGSTVPVTAVGDDDQSIYSFSGARVENFQKFTEMYPNARTIRLEQNYRSSKTIVEGAHGVIRGNKRRTKKALWTNNPQGCPIYISECRTPACEMQLLVDEIRERIRSGDKASSIAILYRMQRVGNEVKSALYDAGIPFSEGNGCDYDFIDVDKIVSFIRLIVDPFDRYSTLRVMRIMNINLSQTSQKILRFIAREQELPLYYCIQYLCMEDSFQKSGKCKCEDGNYISIPKKDARQLEKIYKTVDHLQRLAGSLTIAELLKRIFSKIPFLKSSRPKKHMFDKENVTRHQRHSSRYTDKPIKQSITVKDKLLKSFLDEARNFTALHPLLWQAERSAGVQDSYGHASKGIERLQHFLDHIVLSIREGSMFNFDSTNHMLHEKRKAAKKYKKRRVESRHMARQAIWIGTVHAAKGLEWDSTFIVRVNEEVFPVHSVDIKSKSSVHTSSANTPTCKNSETKTRDTSDKKCKLSGFQSAKISEEERRLAYVAFSRARKRLYISYVLTENHMMMEASRFLSDIPAKLKSKFYRYGRSCELNSRKEASDTTEKLPSSNLRRFIANPF